MHFCHKMATEEASEHSKYDSLLTQKSGQKIWCPKMVEFGSVEISEPPKSTILGWVRDIFSAHTKGVPKPA